MQILFRHMALMGGVTYYYSEWFFILSLVCMKSSIFLGIYEIKYFPISIRSVGLNFYLFLSGFAVETVFANKNN